MERLWTPWRMEYIKSATTGDDAGCIFCELPQEGDDERTLILARREGAFVILNRFPYNPGHLMVAPFRHVGELTDLEDDELAETVSLVRDAVRALRDEWEPSGFNVGMNLGRVAGAGVPGHLHWHVVPRWHGDSNFMPVIGQTKVLPELLQETYGKLRPAFEG
ncbi:MAG TPA: HIT domain-containing protein [Actinomycetota bacterium]